MPKQSENNLIITSRYFGNQILLNYGRLLLKLQDRINDKVIENCEGDINFQLPELFSQSSLLTAAEKHKVFLEIIGHINELIAFIKNEESSQEYEPWIKKCQDLILFISSQYLSAFTAETDLLKKREKIIDKLDPNKHQFRINQCKRSIRQARADVCADFLVSFHHYYYQRIRAEDNFAKTKEEISKLISNPANVAALVP